jgi:hypothetical protein
MSVDRVAVYKADADTHRCSILSRLIGALREEIHTCTATTASSSNGSCVKRVTAVIPLLEPLPLQVCRIHDARTKGTIECMTPYNWLKYKTLPICSNPLISKAKQTSDEGHQCSTAATAHSLVLCPISGRHCDRQSSSRS